MASGGWRRQTRAAINAGLPRVLRAPWSVTRPTARRLRGWSP